MYNPSMVRVHSSHAMHQEYLLLRCKVPKEKLFNLLIWYLIVPNNRLTPISMISSNFSDVNLLMRDGSVTPPLKCGLE